ncbi:hypothetical protein K438DRAFT_1267448 [Mycena galopus ATCC 62051]|nr:hypothetical protein K438DRAFT_1267448 [Mycena galopus ATCC 62051]
MSSPPFLRNPHNTPVARPFQRPLAIQKAPIVNPYQKFTQPQFDAWIGDITGALRDALGYQAELPSKPKSSRQWHISASEGSDAPDATDVTEEDTDADVDDSFAEVNARRATSANAKGKGRDPREGPGLGGKEGVVRLLKSTWTLKRSRSRTQKRVRVRRRKRRRKRKRKRKKRSSALQMRKRKRTRFGMERALRALLPATKGMQSSTRMKKRNTETKKGTTRIQIL